MLLPVPAVSVQNPVLPAQAQTHRCLIQYQTLLSTVTVPLPVTANIIHVWTKTNEVDRAGYRHKVYLHTNTTIIFHHNDRICKTNIEHTVTEEPTRCKHFTNQDNGELLTVRWHVDFLRQDRRKTEEKVGRDF